MESVPELAEFRVAVDKIGRFKDSVVVKAYYLLAARNNELTCKISESRKKLTRCLGNHVSWEIVNYNGMKVLLVKCPVLKRKRKSKKGEGIVFKPIALPIDPKYEPWTLDLLKWIKRNNGKLNFNLTDNAIEKLVKRNLNDYFPNIYPHFLRHTRLTHLVSYYDFDPYDVTVYAGWTFKTGLAHHAGLIITGQMDIYLHLAWKRYFPKLLKPLV